MSSGVGVLVGSSSQAISSWAVGSLAIAVGAAIFVGFLTPVASTAAAVGYLITGVSSFLMTEANHNISTLGAFNLAAISAALVLPSYRCWYSHRGRPRVVLYIFVSTVSATPCREQQERDHKGKQ